MTLNLDPAFQPIDGQNIDFETFTFSGGEPHIRIQAFDTTKEVIVTHRIKSFNDLGLICVAIDALKRMGAHTIDLLIPYFPGARQDRVMVNGESLTVKVYADIINNLGIRSIKIFDPHSDVTPALLNNCEVMDNYLFISEIVNYIPSNFILVAPDAGSIKKVLKLASKLNHTTILECGKTRDVVTGNLLGFKVPSNDLENFPCLIVDDICDGGATFIGLGKELKNRNAGDLYLAVSHGIFRHGTEALSELYQQIFTTDSFQDLEADIVHQVKLNKILN